MSNLLNNLSALQKARQRGTVAVLCMVCALFFTAAGCKKPKSDPVIIPPWDEKEEMVIPPLIHDDEPFYYYGEEKIYLQLVKNHICLLFTEDAKKEQLISLIESDSSLQLSTTVYRLPRSTPNLDDGISRREAVLESKDGKDISAATIELFRSMKVVASAQYVLHNNSSNFYGHTDKFTLKLNPSTSYEQLLELAEKYYCSVEKREFTEDSYNLFVSKVSNLSAMQTANLFYETGLFEYAEPSLIVFNALYA